MLIGHARGAMFVDYGQVSRRSAVTAAVYALSGLGHQAVIVFFVLSGYFIGMSVLKMWNRWRWSDYLVARVVRLHVVVIPALVITALLDNLGVRLFGLGGWYGGHASVHAAAGLTPIAERIGILPFFGTLVFLQDIITPEFGSNAQLWSLACEFWYYVLFPLALLVFTRRARFPTRCGALLLSSVILWTMGLEYAAYFSLWLLGAAVAALLRKTSLQTGAARALRWASGTAVLVILGITRLGLMSPPIAADALLALAFSAFVYSMQVGEDVAAPISESYISLARFLASFSFSLYVIQGPIIPFLTSAVPALTRMQPGILQLMALAGTLVLVCVLAYLFSRATEVHTETVRERLRSSIRVRAVAQPATSANGSGVS